MPYDPDGFTKSVVEEAVAAVEERLSGLTVDMSRVDELSHRVESLARDLSKAKAVEDNVLNTAAEAMHKSVASLRIAESADEGRLKLRRSVESWSFGTFVIGVALAVGAALSLYRVNDENKTFHAYQKECAELQELNTALAGEIDRIERQIESRLDTERQAWIAIYRELPQARQALVRKHIASSIELDEDGRIPVELDTIMNLLDRAYPEGDSKDEDKVTLYFTFDDLLRQHLNRREKESREAKESVFDKIASIRNDTEEDSE